MEKSKVIRCYNEGRHYVETCLEQIASLEQNNDKELRQVLRGTVMVEVSYKAAENFCKVCEYVINGEDGADILKGKLLDLKEKVRQLYDSADKHKLITIREISDSILREIGEVEEWTSDNESDSIQELPNIETIPDTHNDDVDTIKSNKLLSSEEIKEKLKDVAPFVQAKPNEIIPFSTYYQRLTDGKFKDSTGSIRKLSVIDSDRCDSALFESCVKRADISDIILEGERLIARLFMYYVAGKFKNSNEYKKAAAKAFGLDVKKTRLSGVPNNYRIDFYKVMWDLFPESEPKK